MPVILLEQFYFYFSMPYFKQVKIRYCAYLISIKIFVQQVIRIHTCNVLQENIFCTTHNKHDASQQLYLKQIKCAQSCSYICRCIQEVQYFWQNNVMLFRQCVTHNSLNCKRPFIISSN